MTLLHQAAQKAATVPLVEQLRSIPADAKLRIDTPNALGCMDTCSIPVGRLCHEAASALQQQPEPVASLTELIDKLDGYLNSPEQIALRDELLAAICQQPEAVAPFWYAVVSEKCPVINKAIRSEEVAGEYAQACEERGYTGVEVVPLYTAPPALQHQEVPREPVACKHCGEQQPWVGLCDRMGDLCGKAAARDHAPPSTTRQQTPTHHADCPMAKPGHSERLWNCNCGPLTTRQQEAGGDTRAAFEAWARGYYFDLTRCDPCYVNEPYKHAITDWCWLAWLAAAPSTPEKAGGVSDGVDALGEGQR